MPVSSSKILAVGRSVGSTEVTVCLFPLKAVRVPKCPRSDLTASIYRET